MIPSREDEEDGNTAIIGNSHHANDIKKKKIKC
jgi:hypothetical protein